MSEPTYTHMFVRADSLLAEYLCHVELLDLTEPRAEQLHALHRDHARGSCLVLAATDRQSP
ncbi:hypothetical protein HLB23_28510 [Nocardia uniformis]|uniref:Uncharacterized protein n=1 Tax=Nocardia uniformis TaxID=53432 RepID=A0A849CIJ0_9NOCA|nr:hypothetical protein [Nocardia uniformis]NNH73751.1 hypothetical protein [Nocardia uniformis]